MNSANKHEANIGGPASNPVRSFWNNERQLLDDHRTTEELPTSADVVIVGAGFTGVATAYHLLKDNPRPPTIVILEARQICSGATGRNGGHVKPSPYYNISHYADLYRVEDSAEVASFESANVYALKDLIERENLDCDFHLTRAVDVYLDTKHAKKTEAAYRKLVDTGVVDLHDVQFVGEKSAAQVSGVKDAKCCFTFTAAHLWPSKLVHQLASKLLGEGVNLQADTPVVSVSQDSEAGNCIVLTGRGKITAKQVVHATNAYSAALLPEYMGKIVPVRGVCSHLVSPDQALVPHLVNTYAIKYDAQNYDYLIPRPDGSVIVGGARQRFWHIPERWFGNVRDDELIDETLSYFDGYMQRTFRGWEASRAEPSKVWTGIMGYSSGFMPHVGQVPDRLGQFIIAGFSGHGMPEIFLSSRGLAKMIREDSDYEASGLPRLFKTTAARLNRQPSPLEESLKGVLGRK